MSGRPILHTRPDPRIAAWNKRPDPRIAAWNKRPDPRIAEWISRLSGREPSSPEAKAIYEEAFSAGLVGELCDGLQMSAAADLREARALEAEKRKRWGPK